MRFNEPNAQTTDSAQTTNFEGGEAYEPQNPKFALYKVVANNLLEKKFYESDEESLEKVQDRFVEATAEDPEWPLKLAHFSRQKLGLRDISQLLLVMSAQFFDTSEYVTEYAPKIIQRADELCKVLAIQKELYGKPMPSELLDGVEKSLYNFDRYQYRKYFQKHKNFDFRDVLNIVKPNPQAETRAIESDTDYQDIFERIIKGDLDDYPEVDTLQSANTWEVNVSEEGNNRQAWINVLDRMGLFARIRNARNMRQAGLSGKEMFGDVSNEWIKNSNIFPFRYYQAYKALKNDHLLDKSSANFLRRAVNVSTHSVPDFIGDSVVAVDLSGSMDSSLSRDSKMTYRELASLFGGIAGSKGADVWGFASDAKQIPIDPTLDVLTLQDHINDSGISGGTHGYKVLEQLIDKGINNKRVIFFTDMILYSSWRSRNSFGHLWSKYRAGNESFLYMIDLSSYGQLKQPEDADKVYQIQGWDNSVFDFMECVESPSDIIEEIEQEF